MVTIIAIVAVSIYGMIYSGFIAMLLILLTATPSLYLVFILLSPVEGFGKVDIFQPILFLLVNIFFGVTLRTLWIVFSSSDEVENLMTLGYDLDVFLYGSLLMNFGVICLLTGYHVKCKRLPIISGRIFKNDNWKKFNTYVICIFLLAISTIGILLFLREYGVEKLVMENLVQKRFKEVAGSEIRSSSSYYRWLASQAFTGFIIYFNYFAKNRIRLLSLGGLLLVFLFIESLLFPFLTNTRMGIIAVILISGLIWHYHRGLNVKKIGISGFVIVALISITSTVRPSYGGAKNLSEAISAISLNSVVEVFVANKNLLGIAKTSHIINAIPDKLEYKYGSSMLNWLSAPIPRSLWPGKPTVGLGNESEILEIFNIPIYLYTGIPPGVVAEFYWNFGPIGVLVGMFLLGLFLKWMYQSFIPYIRQKNRNAIVLYIYVGYSFAFMMPGTSISSAIVSFLMGIIPLVGALWFVNIKFTR